MMQDVTTEDSGLRLSLRLIEPDRAAYYLRVSDLQLTTCAVLPLDASKRDMERVVIQHLARKIELSMAN